MLNNALELHRKGHHQAAQKLYEQVLRTQPDNVDALNLLGVLLKQTRQYESAIQMLKKAINIAPRNPIFHNNLGNTYAEINDWLSAIAYFDSAISLNSNYPIAYLNRANALMAVKEFEKAIIDYLAYLKYQKNNPEVLHKAGCCYLMMHEYTRAIQLFDAALELQFFQPLIHHDKAHALSRLGEYNLAIKEFLLSIEQDPNFADAYYNLANIYFELNNYDNALKFYDKAISIKQVCPDALNNKGNSLAKLLRYDEAIQHYRLALTQDSQFFDAYINLGNVLQKQKKYFEAVEQYKNALNISPTQYYLNGLIVSCALALADWGLVNEYSSKIRLGFSESKAMADPLTTILLFDDPNLQLISGRLWANNQKFQLTDFKAPHHNHSIIRVGYYSADFHDHATAYLISELFELHDNTRFQLYAFSFGPSQQHGMQARLKASFYEFYEVETFTDNEIVNLSRSLEIDIAVDLKGYTLNARPGIFALRAAPIQVSYLGFPGSMGVDFIDYLIADSIVIPPEDSHYYDEKIIYLPYSYQVNDSKRSLSPVNYKREDFNLPSSGFVFCCFTNTNKIRQETFDLWMSILKSVDSSVLWLLEDDLTASSNLKNYAFKSGLDPKRLVFSQRLPLPEHLTRHRLADLFLDTLPYNAHTRASDALWAGLPVLTCTGNSFAARVATSLLKALGVSELITLNASDYVERAIYLATHTTELNAIKSKLETNKNIFPLFDTRLFTQHIEAAYEQIYQTYTKDLAVNSFWVKE